MPAGFRFLLEHWSALGHELVMMAKRRASLKWAISAEDWKAPICHVWGILYSMAFQYAFRPSMILALHEKINLTLQHAMLGTGGIEAEDSIKYAELL
jgi:hypothetical protein